MAGRRSKDSVADDFFSGAEVPEFEAPKDDPFADAAPVGSEPVPVVTAPAAAPVVSVIPAPFAPAPVDPAKPEPPKVASAPEDWSDVEVVPRYLAVGYASDTVVNPTGRRGLMLLSGVLVARNEYGQASRIMPGGYVFFSAGAPHALEVEGDHAVRAVFVQSSDYDVGLVTFVPAESGPRAPTAHEGPSWATAPSTIRQSGEVPTVPMAPQPIAAPIARSYVSKAVEQLTALHDSRGRKGRQVRHPNETLPVPNAQSVNRAANGAPQPIQDVRTVNMLSPQIV